MRALTLVACAACAGVEPPPDTVEPTGKETGHAPVTTDTETASLQWEAGAAPGCTAPADRADLGPLHAPEARADWGLQPFDPDLESLYVGGGITAAFLDDDERLDVLVPSADGVRAYLQQPDGSLSLALGLLPTGATDAVSVTPADVDGDGVLDLFVARFKAPDQLWRGRPDGTWEDVTDLAGVAGTEDGKTAAGVFGDVDRDGDLDLFAATHGGLAPLSQPSRLYVNDGQGVFVDEGADLPAALHDGYTFVAAWIDLDDDGWLDLYTVNDFGNRHPNVLLWNRGGRLEIDDGSSGLGVGLQGMGLGIGDLDDDGTWDLVMAGWGNNRIMQSEASAWFDTHRTWALRPDRDRGQLIGWATELADLDHDGDLDVIEGFGHIWNQRAPADQPDEIFLAEADTFVPVGASWGFDHPGQTRGVLAVDLNADGWTDLLRNEVAGPATVQLARCGEAAWTTITLSQPGPNRHAIGAVVTVRADGRHWRRHVQAGGHGVLVAGPPRVHVGLGGATSLASVEVRWPDGTTSSAADLPLRRPLTLTRVTP